MKRWKKSCIVSLLFFSSVVLAAEEVVVESSEIEVMDGLMAATAETLARQKQMSGWMAEFRQAKESFLLKQDESSSARTLVMLSRKLLQEIEKEGIQELFSAPYLEELHFFAALGSHTNEKK